MKKSHLLGALCAFMLVSLNAYGSSLLVAGVFSNNILRYDGNTGAFNEIFIPEGSGGLFHPTGLTYGADNNLYVTSTGTPGISNILKYDGRTGVFIENFIPAGSGGLTSAFETIFGPDGNLYVTSLKNYPDEHKILRYDGQTGQFIDEFVSLNSGGLKGPINLAFGPDSNLYVSSVYNGQIMRYDGTTGAFIDVFADGGVFSSDPEKTVLGSPGKLEFRPDGLLYVSDSGGSGDNRGVRRFDAQTGAYVDTFISAPLGNQLGIDGVSSFVFGDNGNMFLAGYHSDNIVEFNGLSGELVGEFVISQSGGLLNPIAQTFSSSPVPIPPSVWLFGSGLLGLVGMARRKKAT